MARVSSKQAAVDPAHLGPGQSPAAGSAGPEATSAPEGGTGNDNLGSVPAVSRGRRRTAARPPAAAAIRSQLEALFRDTAACAEAARRWSDGPGRLWRGALPAEAGTAAALEHLAIHTRLMQVMNWLLDPHNAVPDAAADWGLKPFAHAAVPPVPPDHPIRSVDGLAVAETSRTITARALALAAAYPQPAPPQPAEDA